MYKKIIDLTTKNKISTLVGMSIIICASILMLGVIFGVRYYVKINSNIKDYKINITIEDKDEGCNGVNNPDYDLGFGFEHEYNLLLNEGDIKWSMPINIVLSCDHKKITISGNINQVIKSSDLSKYFEGENIELIESSGIDNNISSGDYNFDGYEDLVIVYSRGNGVSAIEYDLIFLYDSVTNKFIYNNQLSELENLSVESSDRTIKQYFNKGYDQKTGGSFGFEEITYKWDKDLLVIFSNKRCTLVEDMSSKDVLYYRYVIANYASEQVVLNEVKKMGKGSCLDDRI